jgi:hypothetical protein
VQPDTPKLAGYVANVLVRGVHLTQTSFDALHVRQIVLGDDNPSSVAPLKVCRQADRVSSSYPFRIFRYLSLCLLTLYRCYHHAYALPHAIPQQPSQAPNVSSSVAVNPILNPEGANHGSSNNYARPGGMQNVGNFLTDKPSSRVLAPPGGRTQVWRFEVVSIGRDDFGYMSACCPFLEGFPQLM